MSSVYLFCVIIGSIHVIDSYQTINDDPERMLDDVRMKRALTNIKFGKRMKLKFGKRFDLDDSDAEKRMIKFGKREDFPDEEIMKRMIKFGKREDQYNRFPGLNGGGAADLQNGFQIQDGYPEMDKRYSDVLDDLFLQTVLHKLNARSEWNKRGKVLFGKRSTDLTKKMYKLKFGKRTEEPEVNNSLQKEQTDAEKSH